MNEHDEDGAFAACLIDGAHGVFIPQIFAEAYTDLYIKLGLFEEWQTLMAGPGHEWYWDAWISTMGRTAQCPDCGDGFYVTLDDGRRCGIEQDGDLFAYELRTCDDETT